jgi:hypothetical protein
MFANATGDEQLIEFVRDFGPVSSAVAEIVEPSESLSLLDRNADFRQSIQSVERLETLRAERRVYAAALRLMIELRCGEKECNPMVVRDLVSEIIEGVKEWPALCENERQKREESLWGPVSWVFNEHTHEVLHRYQSEIENRIERQQGGLPHLTPSVHWTGNRVLHCILNSFCTEIGCVQDHPTEILPLHALRFGIRPALYLILRREYLAQGGVIICANDRCGAFFVSERAGQKYHSDDCSRQARQREYWRSAGRRKRRARRQTERRKRSI